MLEYIYTQNGSANKEKYDVHCTMCTFKDQNVQKRLGLTIGIFTYGYHMVTVATSFKATMTRNSKPGYS